MGNFLSAVRNIAFAFGGPVTSDNNGVGQMRPEGRNRRGETRLRGPEVLGPFRGLGIRPLVSVIRGLGNPFPEAP